eukprot:12411639-Karenia_brevis.AAC.2
MALWIVVVKVVLLLLHWVQVAQVVDCGRGKHSWLLVVVVVVVAVAAVAFVVEDMLSLGVKGGVEDGVMVGE